MKKGGSQRETRSSPNKPLATLTTYLEGMLTGKAAQASGPDAWAQCAMPKPSCKAFSPPPVRPGPLPAKDALLPDAAT